MRAGARAGRNEVDVRKAIVLLLVMLPPLAAQATTRYVTDEFNIMMRSGESSNHRITRQLRSGTPVEVLSVNSETGYSQVRIDGGEAFARADDVVVSGHDRFDELVLDPRDDQFLPLDPETGDVLRHRSETVMGAMTIWITARLLRIPSRMM